MADNITDRTINEHEFGLTTAQQRYIEDNWKTKKPKELATEIYQNDDLDEHSDQFDNIKRYLGKMRRNSPTIDLSDEQRTFILKNGHAMKPYAMAKALFKKDKLAPLGAEVNTVTRYAAAIGAVYDDGSPEDSNSEEYRPPTTELQLIKKINESDVNANYDKEKLTSSHHQCIKSLRKYLASPRFVATMETMKKSSLRNLMESTMTQATYDKPDLNSEELNMYINLCGDYVLMNMLQYQMTALNQTLDECVSDDDDGKKLQMSLSDALSSKIQEYDKCQTRMQRLQESLSEKRSHRLKAEASANESLSKLVELFSEEDERRKLLTIAEARNLDIGKEADRLESAPEILAHFMGLGREEIIES